MHEVQHVGNPDRVRANTWPAVNAELDGQAEQRIQTYAESASEELTGRIEELRREWDFERVVQVEAAAAGLAGLALGITVSRKFFALPAIAAGMLLLHAVHGWYPWLPVFRRLGVRTEDEIDRERYALKALRGDFDIPPGGEARDRAKAAWWAVLA
jgi:hypothetical protein